jgi:glycosyltransferase 2 family protein
LAIVTLLNRSAVNAGGIWAAVRAADPAVYALAVISLYAGLLVRGYRWRLLLESAAAAGEEPVRPPVLACLQYILVGRFADSVSPARVGNLYRAYLADEHRQTGFSRTLGTTAAETVLDVVLVCGAVLGVTALLVLTPEAAALADSALAASSLAASALKGGLAAGVGAGLVVGALAAMRRWGPALARRLPARLAGAYAQFHQGTLGSLGAGRLPQLLALTGVAWALAVARWYLVVTALGLSVSLPLLLSLSLANAVIAAVPATPGGLGLVEPGAAALLSLQLPLEAAIAVTLGERAISYGSVVLTGGALFLRLGARRHITLPR